MEGKGKSDQARRRVFKSTTVALLKPPTEKFEGEWPKKPKYWQLHGTIAAKYYWRLALGATVIGGALGYFFYKVQPKISFGYFDRYFVPEMFYTKEEREEFWETRFYDPKSCRMDEYDGGVREFDLHLSSKDLRKELSGPAGAYRREAGVDHTKMLN